MAPRLKDREEWLAILPEGLPAPAGRRGLPDREGCAVPGRPPGHTGTANHGRSAHA